MDAILARCVDRDLAEVEPGVRDLLRLGAYQALRTRIPPHAAVATTVDLAHTSGHARAAGFVNAVLRRVAVRAWTQWTDLLGEGAAPLAALALRTAHPEWIVAAFADALGDDPGGDLAETGRALFADDERWLDLCAGPGGKAALLAAVGAQRGAVLTANERRAHRADLVRRVTAPWDVEVRVGDARSFPDDGFDRVLVDVPCTGLGALRRRPEARWRRRPDDLPDLLVLQRDILDAALRCVRPGGVGRT